MYMESIVNSLLLSAFGGGLMWFCWVLAQIVAETYELFFAVKPKKYKLGDIVQDNFIVHRIDLDGTVYWRPLLTEIPEDEPEEEKIRIPMIRFEDIPFGEIKSKSIDRTIGGVALNDPTRTGVLVLDKDVFSTSVLDDLQLRIETSSRNFNYEHMQLQIELMKMIMNSEMEHDYLKFKEDFYMCLKLRETWVRRREEKFKHGGIALRDPCRMLVG